MGTKTLVPAFKRRMGNRDYFVATMKFAEVAKHISFYHTLAKNRELDQLFQRGISERTGNIKEYLLQAPHRFFNAILVAVMDGNPKFTELSLDERDELSSDLDAGFGVIQFDGTQEYIVLDGQHRLKAIQDAIREDPSLKDEDLCVLLVDHKTSREGLRETRRLFSNLNRHAQKTTKSEDIALDEDDACAIWARRAVEEHPYFSGNGRTKIFSKPPIPGEPKLSLAGNNIPATDKSAFTTLVVLYGVITDLAWDLAYASSHSVRPSDAQLENGYTLIADRLQELCDSCGDAGRAVRASGDVSQLRAPRSAAEKGHAFLRPVIQRQVASIVRDESLGGEAWKDIMRRLGRLDWSIGAAPWTVVFDRANGRMRPGVNSRELKDLLGQCIRIHLRPDSMAEIRRIRKRYREICHEDYPVALEELQQSVQ